MDASYDDDRVIPLYNWIFFFCNGKKTVKNLLKKQNSYLLRPQTETE